MVLDNIHCMSTETNFLLIETCSEQNTLDLFNYFQASQIYFKLIKILKNLYIRITIGEIEHCKIIFRMVKKWQKNKCFIP